MLLLIYLAQANMQYIMYNDSKIIDALGGNQKVAELCSPTIPAVVSGWRKRGIPTPWRKVLALSRPDIFNIGPTLK